MVYYISAEDLYLPNMFVWYAMQMDLYLIRILSYGLIVQLDLFGNIYNILLLYKRLIILIVLIHSQAFVLLKHSNLRMTSARNVNLEEKMATKKVT